MCPVYSWDRGWGQLRSVAPGVGVALVSFQPGCQVGQRNVAVGIRPTMEMPGPLLAITLKRAHCQSLPQTIPFGALTGNSEGIQQKPWQFQQTITSEPALKLQNLRPGRHPGATLFCRVCFYALRSLWEATFEKSISKWRYLLICFIKQVSPSIWPFLNTWTSPWSFSFPICEMGQTIAPTLQGCQDWMRHDMENAEVLT